MGKHNPGVQHRLGPTRLGSHSVERDPGVLVDNKLNMSEQCAAAKFWVTSTSTSPVEI